MSKRYMINSENAAWRVVDGEVVILNSTTTNYYSLNEAGTLLWKLLLDDHSTLEELNQGLASHFGIGTELVIAGVAEFITELEKEDLLTTETLNVSSSTAATAGAIEAAARGTTSSYESPALHKFDTLKQLIVSAE